MFKRIDKKTATDLLKNENSILIDIRDEESFEDGHLDEAIHITQDNITLFIEKTSKESSILVMCYHGNSSKTIAQYLATQGFDDVYSIDGGYEGWIIE